LASRFLIKKPSNLEAIILRSMEIKLKISHSRHLRRRGSEEKKRRD